MKKRTISIGLGAVFVLFVGFVAAFAQAPATIEDPVLAGFQVLDATPSESKLERLDANETLRNRVRRDFPKAILVEETTVDGRPAITFRLAKKSTVTDAIVIDYESHLELHQDELKVTRRDERDIEGSAKPSVEPQLAMTASSAYTNNCSGVQRSPGNPYPCCNTYYQNCTYFAWEQAYRFWGDSLPSAGNAKDWATNLASRFPVAATSRPGLYNIGVNSTLSGNGHVAWTMEIANTMVLVWEQSCGSIQSGFTQKWRSIATFDKGFIQTRRTLPSPYINGHSPQNLVSGLSTQQVVFWGGNFNPGLRAVVTFPNGGRATLKDAQLRVGYGTVTASMVLGGSGWWSIQVFNENGKYTGMYYFYVW